MILRPIKWHGSQKNEQVKTIHNYHISIFLSVAMLLLKWNSSMYFQLPPTAISQIMVGLTITHHIPFTEIFLLIKGHLLPWIAKERRQSLPPFRAMENGSFKKLESRYHAIIFHALLQRCLRNDVESFLSWSLLRKIPPIRVCMCKRPLAVCLSCDLYRSISFMYSLRRCDYGTVH